MSVHRRLLPLAVALALLAGCGSKEDRIQAHLAKGKAFLEQGELEKAGIEIRNVVQLDPKNAEAFIVSGRIEEARKDVRRAYSSYLKTIELDAANVEAKRRLARIYLFGRVLDKAEETADQVLAQVPDDPDALAVKAALLVLKGDSDAAVKQAADVLQKTPGQADAAMLLAGVYAQREDPKAARDVLEKAIAADPKNAALRTANAALALRQQQFDVAEREYVELVKLQPRSFEARLALATFYTQRGDTAKAEATLREAIRAEPGDDKRQFALVDLLVARKGQDAAEAELGKLIEDRPKAWPLRFRLAQLQEAAGKRDLAERTYRGIMEADKDGAQALQAKGQVARLMLGAGKADEGARLLDEVIKANPRDNAALILRASLALARKDAQNAIIDLRTVLRDQPTSPQVLALLATAHRMNDEVALGTEVIGAAIRQEPANLQLRLLMVEHMAAANDREGALRELDATIKANPRAVRAYEVKADLEQRQGDTAAAARTIEALKKELPDQGIGYFRAGQLAIAQKKYDVAAQEFTVSIQKAPQAVEPRVALVALLAGQKKLDEAARAAEDFVKAAPRSLLAHQALGEVRVAQKRIPDAETQFRKMIELDPKASRGYLNLARLQATQGNLEAGLGTLAEGLKADPADAELAVALAESQRTRGNVDASIATYEAVLKASPTNPVAANNLAYLLLEHKTDQASHARALELAKPLEATRNAAFLDTLGWAYYRTGRYDDAARVLQRVVAQVPNEPMFNFHLGMALLKAGKADDGKALLRKALEANAKFPGAEEAKKVLGQG
jgi:tetratricopeptide (TPR) repeat protein